MAKRSLSALAVTKLAGSRIDGHILWFQNNHCLFLTVHVGIVYNKAASGIRSRRGFFLIKEFFNQ